MVLSIGPKAFLLDQIGTLDFSHGKFSMWHVLLSMWVVLEMHHLGEPGSQSWLLLVPFAF